MLSIVQEEKISLLSDTVLYPEAAAFLRHLVYEQHSSPLPAAQIMGLLNIAHTSNYGQLRDYVIHQRDRNWPDSRRSAKVFYTELEKLLTQMQTKRLIEDFRLVTSGQNSQQAKQEMDELMAALALEFIQHLVAENMLLAEAQRNRR